MKVHSLRERRTFERRASACEEHIEKDACYLNLGSALYYVGLDLHKKVYGRGCVIG
jgi:hypothetical protein